MYKTLKIAILWYVIILHWHHHKGPQNQCYNEVLVYLNHWNVFFSSSMLSRPRLIYGWTIEKFTWRARTSAKMKIQYRRVNELSNNNEIILKKCSRKFIIIINLILWCTLQNVIQTQKCVPNQKNWLWTEQVCFQVTSKSLGKKPTNLWVQLAIYSEISDQPQQKSLNSTLSCVLCTTISPWTAGFKPEWPWNLISNWNYFIFLFHTFNFRLCWKNSTL